jgi:hypothetical protein
MAQLDTDLDREMRLQYMLLGELRTLAIQGKPHPANLATYEQIIERIRQLRRFIDARAAEHKGRTRGGNYKVWW